ncbi:MAG: hypothetical protein K2I93_03925 [Oscillospiraceae bacterium]|nr:hypothetical protein [Oscillospiraceae bacterium]
MRRAESDALYLYLIRRLDKLEGELTESQNHLRTERCPDELDCLEHIVALNRLRAFIEFSRDVAAILKMVDIDGKLEG